MPPVLNGKPMRKGRQRLLRSTGSFSGIEDIVAPTPRKIPQVVQSPIPVRKEKRETPFVDAGQELQNILRSSLDALTPPVEKKQAIQQQISGRAVPIVRKLAEEGMGCASPPLRACNPMIYNSPFHQDDPRTISPTTKLKEFDMKQFKSTKEQLKKSTSLLTPRLRSQSWPTALVPKTVAQKS